MRHAVPDQTGTRRLPTFFRGSTFVRTECKRTGYRVGHKACEKLTASISAGVQNGAVPMPQQYQRDRGGLQSLV
jgi:hypothetical protein